MATLIDSSMIGQTCVFRSKNPNDPTTWQGMIQSVCTSTVAQMIGTLGGDLISYNAAVRQIDPTVNSDITQLEFVIITLSTPTGTQQSFAFSPSWMIDGSFSLINQAVTVTVNILDLPNNDHTQILVLLRSGGYRCSIASIQ